MGDAVSLDDLRQMTPGEFEAAMTRLLRVLGFEAQQTQLTADGGIDIWAFSEQPITGGRVIVQCKRYGPDTMVGEPVVREMYGLVHAHGVTKGIVISTSGFTASARRFTSGKPLELVDGNQLLGILRGCSTDSILGRVASRWGPRRFSPFTTVLEDVSEWSRSFSPPYPLRLVATASEYLAQMPDMDVSQPRPWTDVWELCPAIDYLKAEYVLIEEAQFRPEEHAPSVPEVLLTRLRRACDLFSQLEQQNDFRVQVDEYVYGNSRDCCLGMVQQNLEGMCLKFWWKPHM